LERNISRHRAARIEMEFGMTARSSTGRAFLISALTVAIGAFALVVPTLARATFPGEDGKLVFARRAATRIGPNKDR
jgi:hypothetical protein